MKEQNAVNWSWLHEALEEGALVIIPSATLIMRNQDVSYPFRQQSDFWYWTHFPEEEAIFVFLRGKSGYETRLFCLPQEAKDTQWHGERIGPEAACERFGFDEAFPLSAFPKKLDDWAGQATSLYTVASQQNMVGVFKQSLHDGWVAESRLEFKSFEAISHAKRLIKTADEIRLMQTAASISVEAHETLISQIASGWYEFEAQAVLEAEMRLRGAKHLAYESIVASGDNACILHYTNNDACIDENALVLVDAGCEWQHYASDITRTFPVSGRFSGEQKALYELVLSAQKSVIALLRPGVDWQMLQNEAIRILSEGLIDLGIVKASLQNCLEKKLYLPFYMHGIGHWLGLDVHDVGPKKQEGALTQFEPHMALTIEPGLYISPSNDVDERWHGLGVRIEDDFIITAEGALNLTEGLAKEVDEIQSLMQS